MELSPGGTVPAPIRARIAGLGSFLPKNVVTSTELERRLGIPSGWVERITGVRNRRYAEDETVVTMAAEAGRRALEAAGLSVGDIDLFLGASASPYQAIPCTAAFVQRELKAPEGESSCFDVNATCLSFLFALRTAGQLVASGVHRAVLVFSSELSGFSRNPRQWESATLFGDAAAAAVITSSGDSDSQILHAQFSTWSQGAESTQVLGGGTRHHPNDPRTTAEMNHFDMEGQAVLKQAARTIGPFLARFGATVGLGLTDYDCIVPHQASRYGLEMLKERFSFPENSTFTNLADRGNCIAASLPLALAEAVEEGRVSRGDRVLLTGSGAGLTLGALALRY